MTPAVMLPAATPPSRSTTSPTSSLGQAFTSNTTETPAAADSFVDSVGVNVDLPHIATTAISPAASDLSAAHIRHVRIAILQNDASYNVVVSQFLKQSNTKAIGITNCSPPLGPYAQAVISAQNITDFQAAIGNRLEAYEAMNEADSQAASDANWVADLKSCMQGQLGVGLPFIAPAIADEVTFGSALGDLDSMVQNANIHRYFAGRNPDTAGWGGTFPCGVYGALPWALCEAEITAPQRPAEVTETGYNSETEVDATTQAKYLLRTLLVNFRSRIVRTYIYCLLGYTGTDGAGGDGLIDTSLNPKPSFTAISTALALLNDPGANVFDRTPVAYRIDGPSSLEHVLFQKQNGTYVLALWNETSSWNPIGGGELPVSPQQVTVEFPFIPLLPTAITLNDAGKGVNCSIATSLNSMTVAVDDHVTFVNFYP